MSNFLKKVVHNNKISINIGRPENLKNLQDLISSEKKLIDSVERTASDRSKSSLALKEWANAEGPDLSDVCEKVSILFEYLSSAELKSSEHCEGYRQYFKSIRTSEEELLSLKSSKRDLAGKIEALEKKISKMKEENKDLPEQRSRERELKQEMIGLEQSVMKEESALADFKRKETRAALDLKFGALLELAEKTTIIAELGKLLIDSITVERTEPGQHRPFYSSEKTDSIMVELQRCIQEVHFLPAGHATPPQPGHSQSNAVMRHTAELDGDQYPSNEEQYRQDFAQQQQRSFSGGSGPQSFYQQQQGQSMGSNQARATTREDRERERSREEMAKYYADEPVSPTLIDPNLPPRDRTYPMGSTREINSNNFERLPSQPYARDSTYAQENDISAMLSYAEGEGEVEDSTAIWNQPSRKGSAVTETRGTPIYETLSTTGKSKTPSPPIAETNSREVEARERAQEQRNRVVESEDESRSSLAYFHATPESQQTPNFPNNSRDFDSVPEDVVAEETEEEEEAPLEYRHSREPARAIPASPKIAIPSSTTVSPDLAYEKPYVPKENDGAYHPTDDGAYHPTTSIPPPAISLPNIEYSPATSPRLDYEPNSIASPYGNTSSGAARTARPEVGRLGSKYGDLSSSTPISPTNTTQFQPAGVSGYNSSSRNPSNEERDRTGSNGKVNAGAFRRPMATNATQPLPSYSFTPSTPTESFSRGAETRFSTSSNSSSPSLADHIRDSYRASPQYNIPAKPVASENEMGGEEAARFAVAPLNLVKRNEESTDEEPQNGKSRY